MPLTITDNCLKTNTALPRIEAHNEYYSVRIAYHGDYLKERMSDKGLSRMRTTVMIREKASALPLEMGERSARIDFIQCTDIVKDKKSAEQFKAKLDASIASIEEINKLFNEHIGKYVRG